jgi:spore coat polysaccharide biosynthesis protein SpsF
MSAVAPVVAIVQARMGSTRLPGKVLRTVGGTPMLERVIARCRAARRVAAVVVATTALAEDDAVVELCARAGVATCRGPVDDVLRRYAAAAREVGAATVVRVTSDCPLLDPSLLDEVVAAFVACQPDYASNCLERTYPRGLDVEVISRAALERADREARQCFEREHVTPYVYGHPELFRLVSVRGERDLGQLRWTVDTAADLRFVDEVTRRVGAGTSWLAVLAAVEADPALAAINSHVRQKALGEA